MSRTIAGGVLIIGLASMFALSGCASSHHAHPSPAPVQVIAPPAAPPKVVPPALVSSLPPIGSETSALLSVNVRADGSVGNVGIVESSGYPDLDTAVAESMKKFKFAPATANGKPIDYVLHQSVSYKLIQ